VSMPFLGEIGQYSLNCTTYVAINDFYTQLANGSFWDMQTAPDGKIYVANYGGTTLSVINNPNADGMACNLSPFSLTVSGTVQASLPNFISNYFNMPNPQSCDSTVEDTAIIKEKIIPNIFTPNGDGKNDVFTIGTLKPQDEVEIYNRWGTKVYALTNTADAWDGRTTSGEECHAGFYYYLIKTSDEKRNQAGFVQLLR
jgi:gliding motility-associated-like protein